MKKTLDNMEAGTWFRVGSSIMVKTARAVARGNGAFEAVNIVTGDVGCPCGRCSFQFSTCEYEIVEKPDCVIPAHGSIRFDTDEKRVKVRAQLEVEFPQVMTRMEGRGGTFYLEYDTTLDIHRQIKNKYGD